MLAIYLAALDSADNAEAFEAVYERYKRLVYHVACQIVHDPHLAEDVAQEVFLYIAKNFSRLHRQDPHKFAAYLAPIYRDPLRLLAQGYTYREIAAALALRESTVRQRIARGRKLLWKELHDER